MVFLGNAFSLQMLKLDTTVLVKIIPVSATEVRDSGFTSVVGHQDTANVLTSLLGVDVPFNRASIKLEKGDTLYVAQVTGGRLPEGATTLPDGFSFSFIKVELIDGEEK